MRRHTEGIRKIGGQRRRYIADITPPRSTENVGPSARFRRQELFLLAGIFGEPLRPTLGRKCKEGDQRDHEQKHDDEEK